MTRGKRPQVRCPRGPLSGFTAALRTPVMTSQPCLPLLGGPGHRGRMPGSGGTGTFLQPLRTPRNGRGAWQATEARLSRTRFRGIPPTLGPRTFPGCQSRRLLPVCWRAVLWPIQLPSSPVLGLCVVTGHPALPGLIPVLHPVAASWETPRVALRGTRQPQCPQQASETGGSHPPPPRGGPGARGPPKPSSGATSWGDGDLESRLGASAVCTCRGHV